VAALNDVMMEAADPLQFCTLATATVQRTRLPEPPGLVVDLALAGHLQPVLVRASGPTELVGEFGTAVGLIPTVRVGSSRHRLAPGDTLLFYTDGVTERRRGRAQFGSDRLLGVAAQAAGQPAAQLVATVREAVEGYSAAPLDDDVALLAVRAAP
jgi:serine phosphatase RsbU (regulator of sigma subunit)